MIVKWFILHLLRELELDKGLKTLGKWGKYKFCWKNYRKLIHPAAEIWEAKCSETWTVSEVACGPRSSRSRWSVRVGLSDRHTALPCCWLWLQSAQWELPVAIRGHITMET